MSLVGNCHWNEILSKLELGSGIWKNFGKWETCFLFPSGPKTGSPCHMCGVNGSVCYVGQWLQNQVLAYHNLIINTGLCI